MKTGMIVGKFYPPTNGHLYVIEQARARVDLLIVVVGSVPDEEIKGELRTEWLKQLVGTDVIVIHIPDDTPQGARPDTEEYWTIWKENLQAHLPFIPAYLFGSDRYILTLAKYMGQIPVLIDEARIHVPISASRVRKHPLLCMEYIPEIVQKYYKEKLKVDIQTIR